MDSTSILENLDSDKREAIRESNVQGNKIYTVDPSSRHADQMIKAHHKAQLQLEDSTEGIIDRMMNKESYRNFICMNFQHFLSDNRNHDLIETKRFAGNTHYQPRKFGFKDKDEPNVVDDQEIEILLDNLTTHYEKYYNSYLYSNFTGLDYDKHLFDPLIWTSQHIGVYKTSLTRGSNFMYLDGEDTTVSSFLELYRLSKFYEKYINRMVEDNLDVDSIINNPAILYSKPSAKGSITQYVELDGFLVSKGDKSYIIECKNSNTIRQKNIAKFLGKASLIEEVYDIELEKLLITTGSLSGKVRGLKKINTNSLRIFDHRDHKTGYENLIKLLES